jgi:hypothetical protein
MRKSLTMKMANSLPTNFASSSKNVTLERQKTLICIAGIV